MGESEVPATSPLTEAPGGEETPSREPSLFEKAGISPGGQIYTETELGQFFYGGRWRGIVSFPKLLVSRFWFLISSDLEP